MQLPHFAAYDLMLRLFAASEGASTRTERVMARMLFELTAACMHWGERGSGDVLAKNA